MRERKSRSFNRLVLIVSAAFSMGFLNSRSTHAETPSANCSQDLIRLARFQPHLDRLKSFLLSDEAISGKDRVRKMIDDDARYSAFQLEGLSRIYESWPHSPFSKIRLQLKELEDQLGRVDEREEYLNFATKIEAPSDAIDYLKKSAKESRHNLEKFLKPWTEPRIEDGTTRLERIEGKIKEWRDGSEEKERRKILDALVEHLKKIEDLPYDMSRLQKGIHEMRRQLRWVLISIQALNGLVVLEDGSASLSREILDRYAHLIDEPVAKSRFNQIPENPEIKDPIRIHRTLYLALSDAVQRLGEIKSFGENVEALEEALMESDPEKYAEIEDAQDKVELLLGKKHITYYNWYDEAARIKRELKRTRLLGAIREEIEKRR